MTSGAGRKDEGVFAGIRGRVGISSLEWTIAGVMAFLVAHSRDPLLLPLRHYHLLLVCILAGLTGIAHVIMIHRRGRRKWSPFRKGALLLVLAVIVTWATIGEINFRSKKRAVLEAETSALQRVGRNLVVGYKNVRDVAPLVSRGALGGIYVTRRNVEGKSEEEFRDEIAFLQGLNASARRNKGYPLIVAADQEGGIVSHLSPPLTHLPSLAEWISSAEVLSEACDRARSYGEIQGHELAGIGVNLNLSPVADLKIDRPKNRLDFYSLIRLRAIASEPKKVAAVALAYARGLENQGVLATGKHFPGLGSVEEDTHLFSARVETKVSDLEAGDWLPFHALAEGSKALLMLSHVKLAEVDDELPASISRAVVQSILRQKWGFEGLLITDDLSMRVIDRSSFGIGEAAVKAVNAGVDLLLVAYDGEKAYDVLYALLAADKQGRLDPRMLEASRKRFASVADRFLRPRGIPIARSW